MISTKQALFLVLRLRRLRARRDNQRYRDKHPERVREYKRGYYKRNRERIISQSIAWELGNPLKRRIARNKSRTKRFSNNPLLRLKHCLSSRVLHALKRAGVRRQENTAELIGCSPEQLRQHLESQFLSGMNWENRGLRGWHIDHKKPCALFNLAIREQRRACFHFTNLQPLWAGDNISKGKKYAAIE